MRKKINIYMFWLGDIKKFPHNIQELNKKYKTLNFIIGPSKEEHSFLMKNVEYYKKSFEKKIYAFCSDVWRVWKLSQNEGIYIDAFTFFGNNFEKHIRKISKYNFYAIKWSTNEIANGIIGRFQKDNLFYKMLFNVYKERTNIKNVFIWPSGPTVLSTSFEKFYKIKIEKPIKQILKKKYLLDEFPVMFNKEIMYNTGLASWHKTKNDKVSMELRILVRENFLKKWEKREINLFPFEPRQYIRDQPSPMLIRKEYDKSFDKKMNKYLLSEYKKIEKTSFKEKIIWSKFYRFFTFKWIKTK